MMMTNSLSLQVSSHNNWRKSCLHFDPFDFGPLWSMKNQIRRMTKKNLSIVIPRTMDTRWANVFEKAVDSMIHLQKGLSCTTSPNWKCFWNLLMTHLANQFSRECNQVPNPGSFRKTFWTKGSSPPKLWRCTISINPKSLVASGWKKSLHK